MKTTKNDNETKNGNKTVRKTLSFYKKRTCWYAEVPEHTEPQNQMVSGADDMCELLSDGHKRVTIDFVYGNVPASELPSECKVVLSKVEQSNYGATYALVTKGAVADAAFPTEVWLCNVTKTVCGGSHPTSMGILTIRPNDEQPYEGHLPW